MRYILLVVFIFFNCNRIEKKTEIEIINNKLHGQWSIDKMIFNNKDYKKYLYINFMVISEKDKISIPESVHFEKDTLATWTLSTTDDILKLVIKTQVETFDGEYDLKFIKNKEKKILGIELISDDTYIRAFKFFQNFDVLGKDW